MLEYAPEVWHPGLTKEQSNDIEHIQKRALDITYPDIPYNEALAKTSIQTLAERREKRCQNFFKDIQDPSHKLHYLLPPVRDSTKTISKLKYNLPQVRTNRLKQSPINYCLFNFQER